MLRSKPDRFAIKPGENRETPEQREERRSIAKEKRQAFQSLLQNRQKRVNSVEGDSTSAFPTLNEVSDE